MKIANIDEMYKENLVVELPPEIIKKGKITLTPERIDAALYTMVMFNSYYYPESERVRQMFKAILIAEAIEPGPPSIPD